MTHTPDNAEFLHYAELLPPRFKQVPAWNDLADAVTKVIERNIDNPRRKLTNVRDSAQYRAGQTLKQVNYLPSQKQNAGLAYDSEGNPVSTDELPTNTIIPSARILKIFSNNSGVAGVQAPLVDYALIEFTLSDGRQVYWNMPVNAPQERSLLIQNAHMLGFDFFNTAITEDDYRRINEFIAMYWPESGTDTFISFISFIKGIRLEAVPLWSYENGTDEFPVLEPKPENAKPAYKGGTWYETSHVELRYNPLTDVLVPGSTEQEFYSTIESLFYYFAPINLVLQRIVAALDLYLEFFVSVAGQEMQVHYAKAAWTYGDWFNQTYIAHGSLAQNIVSGRIRYEWPMLKGANTQGAVLDYTRIETGIVYYEWPVMETPLDYAMGLGVSEEFQLSVRYQWPLMRSENTQGAALDMQFIESRAIRYIPPDIEVLIYRSTNVPAQMLIYTYVNSPFGEINTYLDGMLSKFEIDMCQVDYGSARGTYLFDDTINFADTLYPNRIINSYNGIPVTSMHTIIFGNNERATSFYNDMAGCIALNVVNIFSAKAVSARRL